MRPWKPPRPIPRPPLWSRHFALVKTLMLEVFFDGESCSAKRSAPTFGGKGGVAKALRPQGHTPASVFRMRCDKAWGLRGLRGEDYTHLSCHCPALPRDPGCHK